MLLKMRVEMDYFKLKCAEKFERVLKDDSGANDGGGFNMIFTIGAAIIIFGIIIVASKDWFTVVLPKLFEKVETVLGL